MCRNIRTLFNFEPPATEQEIRDASLQFVRRLSGFNVPSKANEVGFNLAIAEVAAATCVLVKSLTTTAGSRDRRVEAARAQAKAAVRFGVHQGICTLSTVSTHDFGLIDGAAGRGISVAPIDAQGCFAVFPQLAKRVISRLSNRQIDMLFFANWAVRARCPITTRETHRFPCRRVAGDDPVRIRQGIIIGNQFAAMAHHEGQPDWRPWPSDQNTTLEGPALELLFERCIPTEYLACATGAFSLVPCFVQAHAEP